MRSSFLLRTMDLVVAVPPEPEAASTAMGIHEFRVRSARDYNYDMLHYDCKLKLNESFNSRLYIVSLLLNLLLIMVIFISIITTLGRDRVLHNSAVKKTAMPSAQAPPVEISDDAPRRRLGKLLGGLGWLGNRCSMVVPWLFHGSKWIQMD